MGLRNLTAARARALANNTCLCRPDQSFLEIMNWRVRATTPEPYACHICTGYLRSLFNWKDSSRRLFCQTRAERRKPGSLREAEHLCLFSPFDGSTPLFFHPRTQPAGRPIPSALQLLVATVTSPPALARGRWRCTRVVCFYLPSGVLQQRLRKWVLQSTGALVKAAKKPREKAECSELEAHDFTRDTQRSITDTIPQNVANLKQHS